MSDSPETSGGTSFEIYTLDCGQADAHLVITPDNERILIDADEEAVGDELDELLVDLSENSDNELKREIDRVAITHIHDDHVAGLEELAERGYTVSNIYIPDKSRWSRDPQNGGVNDEVLAEFQQSAAELGVGGENSHQVVEGDEIHNGISVLSPPSESGKVEVPQNKPGPNPTHRPRDANQNSMVVKVGKSSDNKNSALFVGDLENVGEQWITKQHEQGNTDLSVDQLHVGHHGSNNATSNEFLEAVNPNTAVISSGTTNSYNHPSDEVVERLDDQNVDIFWTGSHGTIKHAEKPEHSTKQVSPADILALKYYAKENDVTKEELTSLEEGSISPEDLPRDTPELAFKSKYLDTAEKAHRTIRRYPKDAETLTLNRFPKAMSTEYVSVDQHEADVPALDGDAEELSPKAHRLTEDLDATIEACMEDVREQRQEALQRLANDPPRSRSTHSRQQSKSSKQSFTQTTINTHTNKDSGQSERNNRTRKR